MKKAILLFSFLMTLFAVNLTAQEVRGVETRRAIYEGESYYLMYKYWGGNYVREKTLGTSSQYYGFEFLNLNSISVSVTLDVYEKGNGRPDKIIDTKDVVLKSNEKYIHKFPVLQYYIGNIDTSYDEHYSDEDLWNKCKNRGRDNAEKYYVKYKAFKLQ